VLFLIGGPCLSSSWAAQIVVLSAISFAVLALNVRASLMALLGRYSYAIYLTHVALASAVTALFSLDLVPMFVLVTGGSLGVSYYVIEPLFERHFNRLGHVLASRAVRSKTVVPAA
jgi:peptidoglycan/LPS O-acetylase OafA/YrhL